MRKILINKRTYENKLINAECWIFDLDNTLYPASCNLFSKIDKKMTTYIANFLGINSRQAGKIRRSYYRDYGTTMSGMMALHGMKPKEFLDDVHDIELNDVAPNPILNRALSRLSGRKIIFTNGTIKHAERVLKQLAINHHFDEIFDIISANYIPKPFPEPYNMIVKKYNIKTSKTVMVEDLIRNLVPAAALGMTTVWVRPNQKLDLKPSDLNTVNHVVDDLTSWLSTL